MSNITAAYIFKYQFEIPIKRTTADTWAFLTHETNAWWMNDFRALGEGSTLTLNAECGGQLIERDANNGSLEWYRVQMVLPGKSLYLIGHMAPDWGGPTTSMLKLAVEDRDTDSALMVSDALLGNVTEASASTAEEGWKVLFGEGFKEFAERER